MSLRSRVAISVAVGAFAAAAFAGPAVADDEWGSDGDWDHQQPRLAQGVVTASTLLLRSAPNRGSQVIHLGLGIGTVHRRHRARAALVLSGRGEQ